jgi:hypothetical protein
MRDPRVIIAGVVFAAAAGSGGVAAASPGSPPASSAPAASAGAVAIMRTFPAAQAGKIETILVNARGLPLYVCRPGAGATSKLTAVNHAHGHPVAYKGHLLDTFTSDHAGMVTGQDLQNVLVATPAVAPMAGPPAGTAPAARPGGGLCY